MEDELHIGDRVLVVRDIPFGTYTGCKGTVKECREGGFFVDLDGGNLFNKDAVFFYPTDLKKLVSSSLIAKKK